MGKEIFKLLEQSFYLLKFQEFQTILGSNKGYYMQWILLVTAWKGEDWPIQLW